MTILYSKLSKAFLISLKRLSHIMAWKSKVIELLATSPASSFTPPFPATCAPDTPECLTLCQHSTCILYWGYCACCLLFLGYFSFIHFLLQLFKCCLIRNPLTILHPPPFTVVFFFFAFITSCICLLVMCLYLFLFLHYPLMAGIFLISVSSELSTVPTLDSQ